MCVYKHTHIFIIPTYKISPKLVPEGHGVMDAGHVMEMPGVRDAEALHAVGMPPVLEVPLTLKAPPMSVNSAA